MKGAQSHPQSSAHEIIVTFSLVATVETFLGQQTQKCDTENAGKGDGESYRVILMAAGMGRTYFMSMVTDSEC